MSKYLVRIELTDNYNYPSGDSECGYEFQVPLNEDKMLDVEQWRKDPDGFMVQRFWRDEPSRIGKLVFVGERSWHFRYGEDVEIDEPTYQLGCVTFAVNEYVNLRDHCAEMRTFRVAKVEPLELKVPSI